MRLSDVLSTSAIKVGLQSVDKVEVIEELVHQLVSSGQLSLRGPAVEAVLLREEKMSTGIGGGIAIPHAQVPGLAGLKVVVGISSAGIDFGALDGDPVHVFFLILSSLDNPGGHLETLAEISRVCREPGFVDALKSAGSAEAVLECIRNVE